MVFINKCTVCTIDLWTLIINILLLLIFQLYRTVFNVFNLGCILLFVITRVRERNSTKRNIYLCAVGWGELHVRCALQTNFSNNCISFFRLGFIAYKIWLQTSVYLYPQTTPLNSSQLANNQQNATSPTRSSSRKWHDNYHITIPSSNKLTILSIPNCISVTMWPITVKPPYTFFIPNLLNSHILYKCYCVQ